MIWSRVLLVVGLAGAGLALMGAGAPFSAQKADLRSLRRLQDGQWELRMRDSGAVERVCLGDRTRLLQLRHKDALCERLVLEDGPSAVTVQYVCRGRGYGRTHIRQETPQLIQLETQGIADGLPFDLVAEGRRIGTCG